MRLIGIIAVVTLLFSCTSTVQYFASYPPEIPIDQPPARIAVVTQYDVGKLKTEDNTRAAIFAENYNHFAETLLNGLSALPQIDLDSDTVFLEKSLSSEVDPSLFATAVRNYCDHRQIDGVIVIKTFKVDREKSSSSSDEGTTVYHSVVVSSTLSYYLKSGVEINNSRVYSEAQVDTDEADSFVGGLLTIKPSFKSSRKVLMPLSEETAMRYVAKFKARNENVVRNVYSTKAFEGFDELMQAHRYAEATEMMLPLTSNSSHKIARQAAYNMFVIEEAQGNFTEAQSWLDRSK